MLKPTRRYPNLLKEDLQAVHARVSPLKAHKATLNVDLNGISSSGNRPDEHTRAA